MRPDEHATDDPQRRYAVTEIGTRTAKAPGDTQVTPFCYMVLIPAWH